MNKAIENSIQLDNRDANRFCTAQAIVCKLCEKQDWHKESWCRTKCPVAKLINSIDWDYATDIVMERSKQMSEAFSNGDHERVKMLLAQDEHDREPIKITYY